MPPGPPVRWFKLMGTYAMALVAARDEDDAERVANEYPGHERWKPWQFAEPHDDAPAPPTAPGLYFAFGE